jgi:hypothetical protein
MRNHSEQDHATVRSILETAAQAPGWMISAIIRRVMKDLRRGARIALLEPNRGCELMIERYTFSASAQIAKMGTAQKLDAVNSPDVNFRPQRVTTNITDPGVVLITDARVANVSFTVGGMIDAWQWNANAVDQSLDVPTLTPVNKASFSGRHTGRVPASMDDLRDHEFKFIMSFSGPAMIGQ